MWCRHDNSSDTELVTHKVVKIFGSKPGYFISVVNISAVVYLGVFFILTMNGNH